MDLLTIGRPFDDALIINASAICECDPDKLINVSIKLG
jgi:hypothetical protein